MTITKALAAFASLLLLAAQIHAQEKLPIKFGKVGTADFELKSSLIDSNTNAVVVADVGKSEFIANTSDLSFSVTFIQKKRIKLINKNGFDAATISIPLYNSTDGRAEKLETLSASTYNIENGKVVETKLERSAVFVEKNKNWLYKKFTFPAIKEGSIIEYSYQIKTDFFFNFPSWTFQGEYPVLWSQYEASIPEFFKYLVFSQGYQPYFVKKKEESRISFKFSQRSDNSGASRLSADNRPTTEYFNIDGNIDYHTWIMKDVPALKEEPFTTTLRNSICKVDFQLSQIAYPNSVAKNYMNSWEKVCEQMMDDDNFGIPINRGNGWLDDDVATIVKDAATPMEKARKIYDYIRDNYTCTGYSSYYTTGSLKEIVKAKSGNVADLNLLLIAMLRNQKIDADPVLLSTRSHGNTNELYPIMDRFNYVIAKITIGESIKYLDASRPRLAFGKLPLQVYNGHARVIDKVGTPVFFEADSVVEGNTAVVFIVNNDKGVSEGSYNNKLGYYQSLDLRNQIAKTSLTEYQKSLLVPFSDDIKVEHIQVDSLKLFSEPVAVKYDLEFKGFGESEIVYFNPMLSDAIKKNPFAAAERFYPVEMPYTSDDIYIMNMEIPKGYKVDELPKSARIKLNEDEGMFEYLLSNNGENIQMRCRLVINKAKFLNEDYQTLRDFYGFVVKKEAEQIVFKKIK